MEIYFVDHHHKKPNFYYAVSSTTQPKTWGTPYRWWPRRFVKVTQMHSSRGITQVATRSIVTSRN